MSRHWHWCSVIAAVIAPPALAQDTLGNIQLEALAKQAKAFVPKDEFDLGPSLPSVAGKRFSYIVTPLKRGPDNLICSGFPSWGYWPQDGRLEVGATEGTGIKSDFSSGNSRMFSTSSGLDDLRTFVTFHSLKCQKTPLPGYSANNGFGAKFDVEKSQETVVAIGHFGMIDTSWKSYWSTQTVGDEARQLSLNIRVRMSGTLTDWAPGKSVVCGKRISIPSMRAPYDETREICLFNGKADLFEVVDIRTNTVLYQSHRP